MIIKVIKLFFLMIKTRVYSKYSRTAVALLGKSIQLARKERKWSEQALAERAGISRSTLVKVEKGDLHCEIGLVFELATIMGIKLFDADVMDLAKSIVQIDDKIALLPRRIHSVAMVVEDDF